MALTKVTNSLVAVNAIQGTLIADNAITTVHIVNNAITATQLADNAVTATKIQNGIIATDHLAADLITAAKIADDAISEEHLDATVISSLSTVTANSSDYVMLGDTSDSNNLKKALVSDFAQNEESPTFTGNVQVDGTLGVTGATTLSSTLAVGGNVTGVSNLYVADDIGHTGDSDTYLSWDANNLSIYNGGVQSMYMDASEVVVNNASVDSDFRVESDGNAHMLFVDGGNNRVGIGTSNPVAQLGVGGAGRRIEIEGGDGVIRGYNRSGTAWAGIDFEAASYSFDISGTESVNFNSAGQVTMGGSSHADDVLYLTRSNAGKLLRLYQASTEKTYIGTAVSEFSGSIGIGGITPTTQLHMRTSSSGSYPILMEGDIDNDGGFIGINFGYNGTNYNKAAIHVEGTSGNVQPDMHFLLNSTASSANVQGLTDAKLSILNSGEVGIGTSTPTAELHVYSTSNPEIRVGTDEGSAIAQLAFSDGNGYFLRLGDNANNEDIMFRTYGDSFINGGPLHIGSTDSISSSAEQFSVYSAGTGHTKMYNSSDSYGTLYMDNASTTADTFQPFIILQKGGGNRGYLGVRHTDSVMGMSGSGGISLRTGASSLQSSTERVFIASAGNVGIGTTAAGTNCKLNVAGGINFTHSPGSSAGLNVVTNLSFNNSDTANACGSVYYKSFFLNIYHNNGHSQCFAVANGGGGVGYPFTIMRPDTATLETGRPIDFSFTTIGSSPNTFRIQISSGGGALTVSRTSGTGSFLVSVQVMTGG